MESIRSAVPMDETIRCARAWAGDPKRSLEVTLAVLYALASTGSRLAELKRDATIDHYGTRGIAYFEVRILRDPDYAQYARKRLEACLAPERAPELLAAVETALATYWQLLSALDA